jgi:hypothetical protein
MAAALLAPTFGVSRLTHRVDFVPIETGSSVAALPPSMFKKKGKNTAQYDGAGLPLLVVYCRFVAWAIEQHTFPMPEQVINRFRCSRATAHRWLNALAEAYGVDRPKRDCHNRIREAA